MMTYDPFHLDGTDLAQVIRDNQVLSPDADATDEPLHPLLKEEAIAAIYHHIQAEHEELHKQRRPHGEMGNDPYFKFDEGSLLRPEVIIKMVLEYLKLHPEYLGKQGA